MLEGKLKSMQRGKNISEKWGARNNVGTREQTNKKYAACNKGNKRREQRRRRKDNEEKRKGRDERAGVTKCTWKEKKRKT